MEFVGLWIRPPGVAELLVIFGILMVFFGYKRLPELAKSMGSSLKTFKQELRDQEFPDEEIP